MSLPAPYQEHYYIGDGETVEFPFGSDFTALASANVKCIIYFEDGTNCVPTFTVNMEAGSITIVTLTKPDGTVLTVPPLGSVVRVFRETPEQQNVTASQLQNYTAKQLERIFDAIVAMIQEGSYFAKHKTLNLTETQRDVSLEQLGEDQDQGLLYWDEESGTIKSTAYGQDELIEAVERANNVADEAKFIAQQTQGNLTSHVQNLSNPHQTSLEKLTDVYLYDLQPAQFLRFDGHQWKNINSSATVYWGDVLGNIADQTDLTTYVSDGLSTKVNIDGTSIMTAPLKFVAGSMRGAVGSFLNGVSFWKMDSQGSLTNIANITDNQFYPVATNSINLGRSANTWKDLYLGGKAYVATINNGADLSVPNKSGTLATTADVELAARSGRMLTDQGVWYAKMYSATVAPAAEDGTNYADFSQVDGDNNPIIVIYTRISGAWVQSETIVPPADYDGYVPVTSKIWDISEQAGQQGGRVLWNHTSKEFTPYPVIISFEDIEITGDSTVIMPDNPDNNQITNKQYVDDTVAGAIYQAGYHPDLFDWKWADHQLNDVQWLRADTFSWQSGSVYQAAFDELFNDIYTHTTWYVSDQPLVRTYSPTPAVGDPVYYELYPTTQVGTVTAYDDVNNAITVSNGYTYAYNSNQYVTPTTETVAGITVTYYPGTSGRKIVPMAYMSAVESVYTATGVAWYYIIDIPGKRFKLPRDNSKHGELISKGTTSTGWYRIYTDGWVEQGGFLNKTSSDAYLVTLPIKMMGDDYTATATLKSNTVSGSGGGWANANAYSATQVQIIQDYNNTWVGLGTYWTVCGYCETTPINQYVIGHKYLYFYIGSFTQSAIENTAGLNAELFNNKVDVGHEVIAFQRPTAENNYTWYRKYADGWVEQGGLQTSNTGSSGVTVNLPITMADTKYFIQATAGAQDYFVTYLNKTTSSFLWRSCNHQGQGYDVPGAWQVSGMAA